MHLRISTASPIQRTKCSRRPCASSALSRNIRRSSTQSHKSLGGCGSKVSCVLFPFPCLSFSLCRHPLCVAHCNMSQCLLPPVLHTLIGTLRLSSVVLPCHLSSVSQVVRGCSVHRRSMGACSCTFEHTVHVVLFPPQIH